MFIAMLTPIGPRDADWFSEVAAFRVLSRMQILGGKLYLC